jgi:hypothetical protein
MAPFTRELSNAKITDLIQNADAWRYARQGRAVRTTGDRVSRVRRVAAAWAAAIWNLFH